MSSFKLLWKLLTFSTVNTHQWNIQIRLLRQEKLSSNPLYSYLKQQHPVPRKVKGAQDALKTCTASHWLYPLDLPGCFSAALALSWQIPLLPSGTAVLASPPSSESFHPLPVILGYDLQILPIIWFRIKSRKTDFSLKDTVFWRV